MPGPPPAMAGGAQRVHVIKNSDNPVGADQKKGIRPVKPVIGVDFMSDNPP
ncbi:MAG: hypothetical protein C5S41_00070, partial [Candidatus Methanomarinus sp.]